MSEVKKFDVKATWVPVQLVDENSKTIDYTIKPAPGHGRDAYLTFTKQRTTDSEGKRKSIDDYSDLDAFLLPYCVWNNVEKRFISEEEAKNLPAPIQTAWHAIAMEVSGLGKKAESDAKKD